MKKLSYIVSLLAAISFSAPLNALAAGIDTSYITPYSNGIIGVINNILLPVLISIAFIVFLYGVFKYFIKGADNETERETGRSFVLWGVIGFVVIFSVWGLVNLVMGTFGFSANTNAPNPPTIGAPAGNQGGDGGGGSAATCQNMLAKNFGQPLPCVFNF
jgi:hypothetical protein